MRYKEAYPVLRKMMDDLIPGFRLMELRTRKKKKCIGKDLQDAS